MSKINALVNMTLAAIIYPFKKTKFKNENIWLIGGHAGDIYDDNSKFLYEYILKIITQQMSLELSQVLHLALLEKPE